MKIEFDKSEINKYNYVLFSPGGESFDCYKNYLDRGKHFNKLMKKVFNEKYII